MAFFLDVIVLFADSPARIFVCPINQVGLAEELTLQIEKFVAIDEKLTGAIPGAWLMSKM